MADVMVARDVEGIDVILRFTAAQLRIGLERGDEEIIETYTMISDLWLDARLELMRGE